MFRGDDYYRPAQRQNSYRSKRGRSYDSPDDPDDGRPKKFSVRMVPSGMADLAPLYTNDEERTLIENAIARAFADSSQRSIGVLGMAIGFALKSYIFDCARTTPLVRTLVELLRADVYFMASVLTGDLSKLREFLPAEVEAAAFTEGMTPRQVFGQVRFAEEETRAFSAGIRFALRTPTSDIQAQSVELGIGMARGTAAHLLSILLETGQKNLQNLLATYKFGNRNLGASGKKILQDLTGSMGSAHVSSISVAQIVASLGSVGEASGSRVMHPFRVTYDNDPISAQTSFVDYVEAPPKGFNQKREAYLSSSYLSGKRRAVSFKVADSEELYEIGTSAIYDRLVAEPTLMNAFVEKLENSEYNQAKANSEFLKDLKQNPARALQPYMVGQLDMPFTLVVALRRYLVTGSALGFMVFATQRKPACNLDILSAESDIKNSQAWLNLIMEISLVLPRDAVIEIPATHIYSEEPQVGFQKAVTSDCFAVGLMSNTLLRNHVAGTPLLTGDPKTEVFWFAGGNPILSNPDKQDYNVADMVKMDIPMWSSTCAVTMAETAQSSGAKVGEYGNHKFMRFANQTEINERWDLGLDALVKRSPRVISFV